MREHGPKSVKGMWRYARHLNDEYAKKVGAAVANFAYEAGADVIVFEDPDSRGNGNAAHKRRNCTVEAVHDPGDRVPPCTWSGHARKPHLSLEHKSPRI